MQELAKLITEAQFLVLCQFEQKQLWPWICIRPITWEVYRAVSQELYITFKKWKWIELPFLHIFCCSGHSSMWKYIVFRDKFMYYMHRELKAAMYSILLYCLFAYTQKFKNTNVNMMSLGWTLKTGTNLALIHILSLSLPLFCCCWWEQYCFCTVQVINIVWTNHFTWCAIGVLCSYPNLLHMLFG